MKDLHPNITFTYTLSSFQEGTIFLDTYISKNNNVLNIGIYRKPSHLNSMLNFYSHYVYKTKTCYWSVQMCTTICNNIKTLVKGKKIIRKTLENNNYPVNVIKKTYSLLQLIKVVEKKFQIKNSSFQAYLILMNKQHI